ncbi:nucleotidyltransferase family protein [Paenibacillus sp. YPG26]|uniref:nucleotidyltransferase family protein n=1 Tax=Paenibacillus sp. YPG26 TaxID=2878915 RepID=UPI00203E599E|nr:nucleotidyltransferase family protein [Paenibacillus sp. YPG26]USB34887.1 nucleotidyltransferase family protein [Paenibacillus sp. YPG26]
MLFCTEEDIICLIEHDEWMLSLLKAAARLELPDWWICAGAIRSKLWDVVHGYSSPTPLADIDVIFFDPNNPNEAYEKELEQRLLSIQPGLPWSIKNQARMHIPNNLPPYKSSEDAISKFPETATSIGISLSSSGAVILTAPWGIQDLIDLQVQPTPFFKATPERLRVYEQRMDQKQWDRIWPRLSIYRADEQ